MINKKDFFPAIKLSDFDYDLPKENIAYFPLEKREQSKLLFADCRNGGVSHHSFNEISDLLPQNSLLVFNNTKVISARINFKKETGGRAEILLVDPLYPSTDPQIIMSADSSCSWKCIIGGKKLNEGLELNLKSDEYFLNAKILKRWENEAEVQFSYNHNKSFAEVLSVFGNIPLPPYIKREAEQSDKERYQTVYAAADGSVAAPTAGLHFSDEVISKINEKKIEIGFLSLHVGPGTFLPVESDDVSGHEMHEEQFFADLSLLQKIKKSLENHQNIIATGTTSLRTLESLYWMGAKMKLNIESRPDFLDQFDSYYLSHNFDLPDRISAINKLIEYCFENNMSSLNGRTKLLIVPGYEFKIADGLITNYHIPKSTLILLVAAFMGEDLWKQVYSEAIKNDYRFLSYGDSSFLLR